MRRNQYLRKRWSLGSQLLLSFSLSFCVFIMFTFLLFFEQINHTCTYIHGYFEYHLTQT